MRNRRAHFTPVSAFEHQVPYQTARLVPVIIGKLVRKSCPVLLHPPIVGDSGGMSRDRNQ
jgi:hypothetical protein